MESPIAVANYFIQKSFDTGVEITPMKVLKLVYLSHGWNLGLKDAPLISEAVQAWKYGPVVESVYHEFKNFGKSKIISLGTIVDFELMDHVAPIVRDADNIALLEYIWKVYKDYNGLQLSALTHQPGTPWDIVWNQMNGQRNNSAIISNDIIKEHYKAKLSDNARHQQTASN